MEELQSLLRYYNLSHLDDMEVAPWSKQYCEDEFPRYWQVVYSILEKLDRKLRIIEIGCGLGDVTTIPCYLGFDKVISLFGIGLLQKSNEQPSSDNIDTC